MNAITDFAKNATESELVNYIKKCNIDYYNNEPQLSDSIYDTIKDILDERFPNNQTLDDIGAPVKADRTKVKIPYYMGSIDKIKTTNGILKFQNKHRGNYILSDKEDGTSALLVKKDDSYILYKRGDRTFGRDISHILNYIKIPTISSEHLVIRGELIISKDNYEAYKHKFSNARNMVNGVVNSITINPEYLKLVDFICFEIIEPSMKPSEQFKFLNAHGFITPSPKLVSSETLIQNINSIPDSYLYKYLQLRKERSSYDIDGIIVTQDVLYEQVNCGNPRHSIGFKANSFGKITTIKNIEWNTSKHGVLIPKIEFDQIELSGSQVRFCSGYNAKYIIDNNLGQDSVIRVVLSGEIIPKITEFIQTESPDLPPPDTYTSDGVNFHAKSSDNSLKRLTHFFKTLEIDNMGEGIIKKLMLNGYDSIRKILEITIDQLNSMDGFQKTLAEKIYHNIHSKIDQPINCEILMCASLCFGFGFGIKKIKTILRKFPYIAKQNQPIPAIENFIEIDGIEEKTAVKFIKGVPLFKGFIHEHPMLTIKYVRVILKRKGKLLLSNEKIVMTGFRDGSIEKKISMLGGTIQGTINKSTTLLIVKDLSVKKGKVLKAEELGIKIISLDDFKNKYIKLP